MAAKTTKSTKTTSAKTTAAKTTKKKASETADTATKTVADVSTTAVERAEKLTGKAQAQYLSLVEQGQDVAQRGYSTVVDAVGNLQLPNVPALDSVTSNLPTLRIPTETLIEASDNVFDFAAKVVETQREFTKKVLTAVGPAVDAEPEVKAEVKAEK